MLRKLKSFNSFGGSSSNADSESNYPLVKKSNSVEKLVSKLQQYYPEYMCFFELYKYNSATHKYELLMPNQEFEIKQSENIRFRGGVKVNIYDISSDAVANVAASFLEFNSFEKLR
uniref:Uncharacterized protein n=1 Tax=Ditylenchus dipsaci TaxID=166011 RepID=A0A915DG06_9BILA